MRKHYNIHLEFSTCPHKFKWIFVPKKQFETRIFNISDVQIWIFSSDFRKDVKYVFVLILSKYSYLRAVFQIYNVHLEFSAFHNKFNWLLCNVDFKDLCTNIIDHQHRFDNDKKTYLKSKKLTLHEFVAFNRYLVSFSIKIRC